MTKQTPPLVARQTTRGNLTIDLDERGAYRILLNGHPPRGISIAGVCSLAPPDEPFEAQIKAALRDAGYTHSLATVIGLSAAEAATLESAAAAHPARLIANYDAVCAAIPGLREIDAARRAIAAWHREFNAAMNDEMRSSFPPRTPQIETSTGTVLVDDAYLQSLAQQYPRAAAFHRARAESRKVTTEYAAAGCKAMMRLYAGEPIETVMADMNAAISAATDMFR